MSSIVLVHGAWSDASAWTEVAQHLTSAGHSVEVPDLPAHGADTTSVADASLAGYADAVIAATERLDGPVVLVGHSMAGIVISTVAEQRPELVSHLVYLAAFLLPSGQSLYGFTQSSAGMASSALGPALRPGEGVLGVDPEKFIEVFCADVPFDVAHALRDAMRPDPINPLGTPITVTNERWGTIPRTYIHTTNDRCVSPESQGEMVTAVGVGQTLSISSSHLPMISQPTELSTLLLSILPNQKRDQP